MELPLGSGGIEIRFNEILSLRLRTEGLEGGRGEKSIHETRLEDDEGRSLCYPSRLTTLYAFGISNRAEERETSLQILHKAPLRLENVMCRCDVNCP